MQQHKIPYLLIPYGAMVVLLLVSCGGPLVPSERLVDQYFSTWNMELVKEVTVRGYGTKGSSTAMGKYPAFVPVLERTGMGVLVLPPQISKDFSGSQTLGLYWHPEDTIVVSGRYEDLQTAELTRQMNAVYGTQVVHENNSYQNFDREPSISAGLLSGTPILALSYHDNSTVMTRSAILDVFQGVTLDGNKKPSPRITTSAPPNLVGGSFANGYSSHFWAMGGKFTGIAYYQVDSYPTGNSSYFEINYNPTTDIITVSPNTSTIVPVPTSLSAPGFTHFIGDEQPSNGNPLYFFESIETEAGRYRTRRYTDTTVSDLGSSSRFPLHAYQSTIILEEDADGNVYIPKKGDKKIATKGLAFLQAYRKGNGDLYFLFTQRILTSGPTMTVRTWAYKY